MPDGEEILFVSNRHYDGVGYGWHIPGPHLNKRGYTPFSTRTGKPGLQAVQIRA